MYWPYTQQSKDSFDIKRYPGRGFNLPSHGGVDDTPRIKSKNIPIIASDNGYVTIGSDGYGGKWIQLWAASGKRYFSLHLDRYAVANKATVKAGQTIGYMGTTGNSTGIHVHFEVRLANGSKVDPDKQGLKYFSYQGNTEMITIQKPITIQTLNSLKMYLRKEPSSQAETWGLLVEPKSQHKCNIFAIGERLEQNGRALDLWYRINIAGKDGFVSACWADEIATDCTDVQNQLNAEKAKTADYTNRLTQINSLSKV